MKAANSKRRLHQPDAIVRIGLSKSTIYEIIRRKQLNAPIKLGARAVGWLESDLDEFLDKLIKAGCPEIQ